MTVYLLVVLPLFTISIAFAIEDVPVQPTPERLLEISAWSLASGIRTVTDGQLPFMKRVRQGRTKYQFNEMGKPVVVMPENVDLWETAFLKRLELYSTAAQTRGVRDIAGVYNISFDHSDCGSPLPKDSQIEITQDGFSFRFILKEKIDGVGTIVEDAVVLNLGNTIGSVPYWVGKVDAQTIELKDSASNCRIVLTKP